MELECLLVLVLSHGLFVFTVTGFNVDTRLPTVRSGPRDSMFGFDVSQHIDKDRYWLLVGAPQAETPGRRPLVQNGGALYGCLLHESLCRHLTVDERGSNIQWDGTDYVPVEQKSHQWFGSTVYSTGRDGVVVACAPSYVHFTSALDKREPVGSCWVMKNAMADIKEYTPCRARANGHDRLGFCQAGFSAAISDDGSQLMMGAVGSYFWQGQVFVQDLNHAEKHNETLERPPWEDNSYLGYSVAPGHFSGSSMQDFAVGMPKGNGLTGKVVLFTNSLRNITEILGEQIGEYFGYSIAVDDFNGDSLDDVAVGAPFHSDYTTTEVYESGAVYVHYQNTEQTFPHDTRTALRGKRTSRARFGLAVSAIGDINNDRYKDLAVGAPYDGADGHGAVYIYHGSPEGVQVAASQVVYAADIGGHLSTFGYSLSSGLDMDRNGYPDILVGAYEANSAVLLRSRPIIQMSAEVELQPDIINLDEKRCSLNDSTPVLCFSVSTCLSYTGLNVPDYVELRLQWRLDSLKTLSARVFYLDDRDRATTLSVWAKLQRGARTCVNGKVYVRDNIRDKLTPIGVQLNYSLREELPLPRRLTPILDVPNVVTVKGQILKYCGDDNLCIPDLAIFANSKTKVHIIGRTQEMKLAIQVKNLGEDAFESLIKLQLPEGVSYINVFKVKSPLPVTCSSYSDKEDISTVVCDIGNPLPAGALVHIILKLSAAKVNGMTELMTFLLRANR
ncbi:Integrin alpha-PS2 [Lamellibrachia satsuma]|nr:Integrin alpha-PS2 [Lamellibrachia satsuma]